MLGIFSHPEHIGYLVGSFKGRGTSGTIVGLTLVGSIVLFGNATRTMKTALVVMYTVLNLLHWIAAIPPTSLSWHIDFSISGPEVLQNLIYTTGLWTAI